MCNNADGKEDDSRHHDQSPLFRDQKLMAMRLQACLFIFTLYAVILIVCQFKIVRLISHFGDRKNIDFKGIQIAVTMSLIGSSIFYSRKLYVSCINGNFRFLGWRSINDSTDVVTEIGTFAYFLFRPLFGVAFSILIYALWRLSVSISEQGQISPTSGFLYITMTLGFLSGFLAGRVLPLIEEYGVGRIGTVLKKDVQHD